MNNAVKGEVEFEVGGNSYVIRHSFNSICEIEGITGRGFYSVTKELSTWAPPTDAKGKLKKETAEEAEDRLGKVRNSTLRAVFCAMLRDKHPGITLHETGELITAIGAAKAVELVGAAFERGQDAPETKGERPIKNGQDISVTVST